MSRVRSLLQPLFALIALSISTNGISASDVSARILRAERFEDWNTIIKLSQELVVRDSSDVSALTAVLDACIAQGCERNPPGGLRSQFAITQLQEFAKAWIDFGAHHPRRARDRFRTLATKSTHGWLGMYGLLSYATETNNANLIKSTLEESEKFLKQEKLISGKVVEAQLALAVLTRDYERIPQLLQSADSRETTRARFLAEIDYLTWKDELVSARKVLDRHVARFGYDHYAAGVDIELRKLMLPPRRVVSEIDHLLRKYPNYWMLRLAQMPLLVELEEDSKAIELIESGKGLPLRLAYARLMQQETLVLSSKRNAAKFIQEMPKLASAYDDYPIFHVVAAAAYMQSDNNTRAIHHLDLAEQQTPSFVPMLLVRASLAEKTGNAREAIDLHRRVASKRTIKGTHPFLLADTLGACRG